MSPVNSRAKGSRFELILRNEFRRLFGWMNARRSQQYMGATGEAADITIPEAPWLSVECKAVSKESVRKWMSQTTRDAEAANKLGILCHKSTPRGLAGHVATGRPAGTGTEIEQYENGGKRERIRERYDLLPARAIKLVAIAMGEGAIKYGDENWKGLPESNLVNHALRHIMEYLGGDRDEPHLSHAAANLLMLANTEEFNEDSRRSR